MWIVAATVSSLPTWYIDGMVFLFGAMVGSFLNVCIYRIPQDDLSIAFPARSFCPSCKAEIRWYDNIPILGYLWLKGRCRSCKTSISLQYPLVELMTAILALALLKRFGLTPETAVFFVLICALLIITFIDLAFWIIPDIISLPGIVLGLLAAVLIGPPSLPSWQDALLGVALGGGSLLCITLFYEFVLKRPGLGLGDAKLLAMLGAFLGWRGVLMIVFLASFQGIFAAIVLYALGWRHRPPVDDDEPSAPATASVPSEPPAPATASVPPEPPALATASVPPEPPALATASVPPEPPAPATSSDGIAEGRPAERTSEPSEPPDISEPTKAEAEVEPDAKVEAKIDAKDEEEEDVPFRQIAIPFGPFLALGALEYLFWGGRIFEWWSRVVMGLRLP